eukprot:3545091-Prymnesium_polylepis.1
MEVARGAPAHLDLVRLEVEGGRAELEIVATIADNKRWEGRRRDGDRDRGWRGHLKKATGFSERLAVERLGRLDHS